LDAEADGEVEGGAVSTGTEGAGVVGVASGCGGVRGKKMSPRITTAAMKARIPEFPVFT